MLSVQVDGQRLIPGKVKECLDAYQVEMGRWEEPPNGTEYPADESEESP